MKHLFYILLFFTTSLTSQTLSLAVKFNVIGIPIVDSTNHYTVRGNIYDDNGVYTAANIATTDSLFYLEEDVLYSFKITIIKSAIGNQLTIQVKSVAPYISTSPSGSFSGQTAISRPNPIGYCATPGGINEQLKWAMENRFKHLLDKNNVGFITRYVGNGKPLFNPAVGEPLIAQGLSTPYPLFLHDGTDWSLYKDLEFSNSTATPQIFNAKLRLDTIGATLRYWNSTKWDTLLSLKDTAILLATKWDIDEIYRKDGTWTGKHNFKDSITLDKGLVSKSEIKTEGLNTQGSTSKAAFTLRGVQADKDTVMVSNFILTGSHGTVGFDCNSGEKDCTFPDATLTVNWKFIIRKDDTATNDLVLKDSTGTEFYRIKSKMTVIFKNINGIWKRQL